MLEKVGERLKAAAMVRWLGVAVMIALMAGTTLAVLGTAFLGWQFGLDRTDLATRINTVAAVSAFVLVAATLFIALIAYLAATGRPDLEVRVLPPLGDDDELVLRAKPEPHPPYFPDGQRIEASRSAKLVLYLVNRSRYSARNPGVRIMTPFANFGAQPGWIRFTDAAGRSAIQWDGGADYLIHGRWERSLPKLDFSGAWVIDELMLDVTVAADGLAPTTRRILIRLVDPDDDHDITRGVVAQWERGAAASDGDPAAGNGDG